VLGRLLGDAVRVCNGSEIFASVESIRQTAIRFRRADAQSAAAVRRELAAQLNDLTIASTLTVVRAFSYFSHLANLAEDVHQNRRRRAHALAGSPPAARRPDRRARRPREGRRHARGARAVARRMPWSVRY
jgi:phosphoenolpyruvate carboxylase